MRPQRTCYKYMQKGKHTQKKRLKNPFWIIRYIWSVESKLKELPLNTNGPRVLNVCTDKRENFHQQHKWMNGFFCFVHSVRRRKKYVAGTNNSNEFITHWTNASAASRTHTLGWRVWETQNMQRIYIHQFCNWITEKYGQIFILNPIII